LTCKVIFHTREPIGLRARFSVGRLTIDGTSLLIDGTPQVSISSRELQSVEMFRMHGTGLMLRIVHSGGVLFVSVIRFSLFGMFAIVNFLGTGRLKDEIETVIRNHSS
jgi:hypothetical protein